MEVGVLSNADASYSRSPRECTRRSARHFAADGDL